MNFDLEQPPASPTDLHSIDLSLELERQLDNESLPPTSPRSNFRPPSLDAGVLVSIITQLRLSLAEITKERDDLLQLLDQATQNQADLKDNLQLVTDRSSSLEEQLSAAQDKHKEDDEAIAMLRAKVEESRRGLMRLQTESRRVSQLTSDSSRGGPSAPSKRMSLISPLPMSPNRGHRRFSSHSDTGFLLNDGFETGQVLSPPASGSLTSESSASTSRRYPALLSSTRASSPSDHDQGVLGQEIEKMKKELRNVRDELEETRHELSEANEAREASEQCAKALRNYIAENQVGETSPGPSTFTAPSLVTPVSKSEESKSASKWSFRLWNGTISANSGMTSATSPVPSPPASTESSSASSPLYAASPPPLTRTFGSLFGSRGGSISSISSTISQAAPLPALAQIPSMYRGGSDASSSTEEEEPISPIVDPPAHIEIRSSESSGASNLNGALTRHEEEKALHDEGTLSYTSTPRVTGIVSSA